MDENERRNNGKDSKDVRDDNVKEIRKGSRDSHDNAIKNAENDEEKKDESDADGSITNMVVINIEFVLQLIVEALIQRNLEKEKHLRQVFIQGDTDGDGVLSFTEFKEIFREVAPDWHERRIMCIFREALFMGKDNDDTIGPQAFASVCAKHGLLKLIDLEGVKATTLLALSMDSEQEKKWAAEKAEQERLRLLNNSTDAPTE
eukprot:CAMPEP_0119054910 /NCGR_PEP_ID=MMETSP1177-20130426/75385_1 /TAXON_ID=2985 /ORGANISM="Ochromonas sp, Strain CCMP1899" /LENGTH=202 /DNA_ID=CAMNT_0007035311 /DNA_START=2728 /DNA_END=3337 /DNA_ORIENTATION=-